MVSGLISKASYHGRSISLPSKPHPIADQFDEHLCRLRSSQAASTSSSLSNRLSSLNDLYHCVDELLQLPLNQQTLFQNLHGKWVEEVLDGSLRLLDICGTSREVLLQSNERLQDIQSVLRRRSSGELSIINEVDEYLNTRKRAKNAIKKCLKSIKRANEIGDGNSIVDMLKDVDAITADIFQSLLSYIAGANLESRKTSWSKVYNLIHQSAGKEAATASEFDAVDTMLDLLNCQKKKSGINMSQVEHMRSQMMKLESEIQNLDELLQCLCRHLVKTRATLLNILSS